MKNILLIFVITFVLIFIPACNGTEETTTLPGSISVISLRENIDLLEMEAKSWQSDAYLAWVNMFIRFTYPENARVVTAQFYSPSKEFESLGVEMSIDGVVSKDPVEHSIPVYQQNPITLNDWTIDSQEALDLMLDQDGLEFIKSKGNKQCSFLRLERLRDRPEQPVAWRLTLTECLGDYVRHILLDPKQERSWRAHSASLDMASYFSPECFLDHKVDPLQILSIGVLSLRVSSGGS